MIALVITLIIMGILLWAVNTYLPLDPKILRIINIVVIVCVVFWLLTVFGVLPIGHDVPVPRLR